MAMTNGIRNVNNMYFSICMICSKVGNPAFFMSILTANTVQAQVWHILLYNKINNIINLYYIDQGVR